MNTKQFYKKTSKLLAKDYLTKNKAKKQTIMTNKKALRYLLFHIISQTIVYGLLIYLTVIDRVDNIKGLTVFLTIIVLGYVLITFFREYRVRTTKKAVVNAIDELYVWSLDGEALKTDVQENVSIIEKYIGGREIK